MADNRDFSRLATNPSSAAAVNAFNDLASEADGALSASLAVAVTNTNTVTITRAQLKSVTRIVLQEGSPVTTGTITVFVDNGNGESPEVNVPLGRFTVINETANSATFYLVGGSSPSGTDLIAAGVGTAGGDAAALIDVLDDDVVSVGGGSGGGGGGGVPDDNSVSTAKIQDNAVTLAKVAHGTQGGLPIYGASGAPTELAAGAANQFLKSQGAGADPIWADVPGSAYRINWMACFLTHSADVTADHSVPAAKNWDTELLDTHGFHSTVSDTSRATIPADLGIQGVRLVAYARGTDVDSGSKIIVFFRKNGALLSAHTAMESPPSTGVSDALHAIVDVPYAAATAGDYFESWIQIETDTSTTVEKESWFYLEVVEVAGGPHTLDMQSETGTAWNLGLDDIGAYVKADNGSAITVTAPSNTTTAIPIGAYGEIEQRGAGAVTVSAGSGATVLGTASTTAQYEVLRWTKTDTDEFVVSLRT